MGVLGHYIDSCDIVNRAPWAINVRYDGEDIELPPGVTHNFPKVVVPFAQRQNPIRGTGHPYSPSTFQTMVGVIGQKGSNCEPLTDEEITLHKTCLERIDRAGTFSGIEMRKVRLLNKGFTAFEAQVPGSFVGAGPAGLGNPSGD